MIKIKEIYIKKPKNNTFDKTNKIILVSENNDMFVLKSFCPLEAEELEINAVEQLKTPREN